MWIGSCEGNGWRYEVAQRREGYVVRAVDLDTGVSDDAGATMFRSAPVAFAHAETMAALDRFVTANAAAEDDVDELRSNYDIRSAHLAELSLRFNDRGQSEALLAAWQVEASVSARPVYC